MPNESREALVHFELYRSLRNSASFRKQFDTIRYTAVEPEVPVGGGSADLVVKAELDGSPTSLLVVEVKRRTKLGGLIFDSDAEDQAKKYAKALSAPYYAITDGQRLRLFKTSNNELVGNYAFSLEESESKQLLKGLSNLHTNKTDTLPFPVVKNPIPEILEQSSDFTNMLYDLFNELSGKRGIVAAQRGNVIWLNIGVHEGILRLGLSEDPSEHAITVQLEVLKKTLGLLKFAEVMKKLSEVPGFQWGRDRLDFDKPFIWTFIRKIIIEEEPDLNNARESLRIWILELHEILEHGL